MLRFRIVLWLFVLVMISLIAFDQFYSPISLAYFLIPILLLVIMITIGSNYISLNFFYPAFTRGSTNQKRIAITFDDGPCPTNTPKVLDLLKKYDAKGSFFCIGSQLDAHADVAHKIRSEGHAIGNHSYSHSSFFSFLGRRKVKEEIKKTDALIAEITGKPCQIFRSTLWCSQSIQLPKRTQINA